MPSSATIKSLAARVVLFVNDDIPDGGVVFFLFADLDDKALDAIIEHPFLDVEGGFGHDDIVFEGIHFEIGDGQDRVVKIKGDKGDADAHE